MGAELQPLTIFYKGTVNTFQQVPHDKAKAIMLLLSGSCSSTISTSTISHVPDGNPQLASNSTAITPKLTKGQVLDLAPPGPNVRPKITQIGRTHPFCAPSIKRSQAELPFARKASLARFLEKRKDRVQLETMLQTQEATKGVISSEDDALLGANYKRPKLQQ